MTKSVNSLNNQTFDSSFFVQNDDVSSTTSNLDMQKSRAGGVITSGDAIGNLRYIGFDGASYTVGAQILGVTGGTIGAGRMPTDLLFATAPDSVTSATLRLTIGRAGNFTFAAPDSGTSITISALSNGIMQVTGGAGAVSTVSVVPIANGGTNASSMATTDGTVYFDGTRLVTTATGTAGQILTSNGAGVAPTYQTGAGATISITGDSGGALTSGSFTFTGGSTGLTFAGAGSTETLGGTLAIANGGTNATSMATTDGVVYFDGTRLVTTAVGTATNVLTSNGAGMAPTFQAVSSGAFPWTVVTGGTQAIAVNNGYIANNAGTCVMTLPATAAVGDRIRVSGMNNVSGWQIAQNSGQTIHFGNVNTTTGAGGTLASTNIYDSVELVCNIANTDFIVLSSIGNITYV